LYFKIKSGPNWTLFGITCAREQETGKLTSSRELVNNGLVKGKKKKKRREKTYIFHNICTVVKINSVTSLHYIFHYKNKLQSMINFATRKNLK
jgi:hypothetical protein